MSDASTIFALASASGKAGVAVFRISGPQAKQVVTHLCAPNDVPAPRLATLREIKDPQNKMLIDRALVLYFAAPHSFTGEDIVELHTHGGRAVANAVIEALQSLPDFRLAEPGEFTRRAFENGKMDLTEAEAIADLVHAETEAQRKQALRQMEGELGKIYEGWRSRLARGLAYMEAAIDFSDEELPDDLIQKQSAELQNLRDEIAAHLDDNHRGERLRDGFSIAILGAPNAGKSSLLNALARRDAAIVSPIAGTTRDVIEVHLDIGGYPVILADTAGLRESSDSIENEGVRRAKARADSADLKLLILDGTKSDAELNKLIDADTIVVVNKMDLVIGKKDDAREISLPLAGRVREGGVQQERRFSILNHFTKHRPPSPNPSREGRGITNIPISALTGQGIDLLLQTLSQEIDIRFTASETPPLTRARHRTALEESATHLTRALQAPMVDQRAEDVRLAMRSLGRITGRVDVEDLLDIIFRDFCIGK